MNRIAAIFRKQLKDTLKNKMTLLQFVMFPVITFFFTEFVAKSNADLPDAIFVNMFSAMYVGMIPLSNTSTIISEEREKKSLRMLVMSNVKPHEYLLGIGCYMLLICSLGNLSFGLMGGFNGAELARYMLAMTAGTVASVLLGSAVGVTSKNQASATALAMPAAMVMAFIPMIAMFNEKVSFLAKFLYTQQISFLAEDLSASNFTADRFIIIGANMLIFTLIFVFAYNKADFKE